MRVTARDIQECSQTRKGSRDHGSSVSQGTLTGMSLASRLVQTGSAWSHWPDCTLPRDKTDLGIT